MPRQCCTQCGGGHGANATAGPAGRRPACQSKSAAALLCFLAHHEMRRLLWRVASDAPDSAVDGRPAYAFAGPGQPEAAGRGPPLPLWPRSAWPPAPPFTPGSTCFPRSNRLTLPLLCTGRWRRPPAPVKCPAGRPQRPRHLRRRLAARATDTGSRPRWAPRPWVLLVLHLLQHCSR